MTRKPVSRGSAVPSPRPRSSGVVQSVDRAMRLLEVLGEDAEGYGLRDLAVRTALSPSTAHRLLVTLEQRRFVAFDRADATWHAGIALFTAGASFASRRSFVAAARIPLRRLRDRTRETANLGVAEAGEVVVLAQAESREVMRAVSAIGGRSPMTSDALGKAILAFQPDDEVTRIVGLHGMRRATPTTITRPGQLMRELAAIRMQGFAIDRGELVHDLRCVAAAILGATGEPVAAISVSGLVSRMPDTRLEELGLLVAEEAAAITALIGGARTPPG